MRKERDNEIMRETQRKRESERIKGQSNTETQTYSSQECAKKSTAELSCDIAERIDKAQLPENGDGHRHDWIEVSSAILAENISGIR